MCQTFTEYAVNNPTYREWTHMYTTVQAYNDNALGASAVAYTIVTDMVNQQVSHADLMYDAIASVWVQAARLHYSEHVDTILNMACGKPVPTATPQPTPNPNPTPTPTPTPTPGPDLFDFDFGFDFGEFGGSLFSTGTIGPPDPNADPFANIFGSMDFASMDFGSSMGFGSILGLDEMFLGVDLGTLGPDLGDVGDFFGDLFKSVVPGV